VLLLFYTLPKNWPPLRTLAARLGAGFALLAEAPGGNAFDEACALPWLQLAARFPQANIPLACAATTIELRGMADTERETCIDSAQAILGYLAEQGPIRGSRPAAPPGQVEGTPVAGAGGHRGVPRDPHR